MNKIKIEEMRPAAGEPIVLAIAPCENVRDVQDYFACDGSILVNLSGLLHDVNVYDFDRIAKLKRLNPDKIIIDLVCTGSTAFVRELMKKSEAPVYMLAPGSANVDDLVDSPEFDGISVIADGRDLRTSILAIFGWAKFPVFTPAREMEVREALVNYINKHTPWVGPAMTTTIDDRGHAISRSDDPIVDLKNWDDVKDFAKAIGVSMREAEYVAFAGVNYVTFGKDDARAVATLLDQVVEERGGDDVKALGDDGISYERLHDRLTGLLYDTGIAINSPEINDPKAEGYHKSLIDEPLILEHPALDCDHQWTKEEWAVICKMCGLPADTTSRIVLNITTMEHFINTDMDKGEE